MKRIALAALLCLALAAPAAAGVDALNELHARATILGQASVCGVLATRAMEETLRWIDREMSIYDREMARRTFLREALASEAAYRAGQRYSSCAEIRADFRRLFGFEPLDRKLP